MAYQVDTTLLKYNQLRIYKIAYDAGFLTEKYLLNQELVDDDNWEPITDTMKKQ